MATAQCWICLAEDSTDKMIYPCKCTGSTKYVHSQCLSKWMEYNNQSTCAVCKYRYRYRMYSFAYIRLNEDLVLSLCKLLDLSIERISPFVSLGFASTAVYIVFTTYGAYALTAIGGSKVADEVLADGNWSLRTWIGLPMIPTCMFLATQDGPDSLLRTLPLIVLGENIVKDRRALVCCALPFLRSLYLTARKFLVRKLPQLSDAFEAEAQPEQNRDGGYSISLSQRTILGTLLFPGSQMLLIEAFSSLLGGYLRFIKWDTFYRNVLGGCILFVAKDVLSLWYQSRKKHYKREYRFVNFDERMDA